MTEIGFYHLQRTSLEKALPRLLEKVLASGRRAVVMAGSPERVEALNLALWVQDPNGFLPHGSAADGNAERQPVWLTAADENPNGATVLVPNALGHTLTPSAVSKLVTRLEERLGVRLFNRTTRRVTVTPDGSAVPPRSNS